MKKTAFVFDLDGTVTKEELLPKISAAIGLSDEISLLTKLTLDGKIPFEDSFKLRCAILRSVPLSVVRDIVRSAQLFPEVEQFIRAKKDHCFINTGNLDVWVSPIAERLGCEFFSSKANTIEDSLLGIQSIIHKGEAIRKIRDSFDRIVVVGDSFNDIPMFEQADVCIAYGATHEPVAQLKEIADFVLYEERALCRLLNML